MKISPYIVLLIGVVAISIAAPLIRLAEAPPLVVATYRMVISALVLAGITTTHREPFPRRIARSDMIWLLLSGISLALHFALWITSLGYTSIASSVTLVTAHPIFVAIAAYLLWREKVNKLAVVGIATALAGVIIINFSGFQMGAETLFGNVLALLAALCMGIYLLIGRKMRERLSLWRYLTAVYSTAAVLLLVVTLVSGNRLSGYPATTYILLVVVAVVPQLIGHSSLNMAIRLLPVTFVSVAVLGEPVGAAVLGYLMLGEVPRLAEILGSLVTLGGILLVIRYRLES